MSFLKSQSEHKGDCDRQMGEYRSRNQKSSVFGFTPEENKPMPKDNTHNSAVVTRDDLKSVRVLTEDACNKKKSSESKSILKGVPKLSLESITGEDNSDLSYMKIQKKGNLNSPTSKETCSWGSPLTKKNGKNQEEYKVFESSKRQVTSNKDIPDLELSQSHNALAQLKEASKQASEDLKGGGCLKNKRELDKLKAMGREKKWEFVEKAVTFNKTQEEPASVTSPMPKFGYHDTFSSKNKRHQDMHQSRAVIQTGTEEDTSMRLRFDARILSMDGRNARREVNGFFFLTDQSITMYEFRRFGTRSNALPIIQRGQYKHVGGRRKERVYCLHDITVGANLTFYTADQPSLPESLSHKKTVTIRITEVDEASKERLLSNGKSPSQLKKETEEYHRITEDEKFVQTIQGQIRRQLSSRGSKCLVNLHHHFTCADKSGDGLLNKDETLEAIKKFRINISQQAFERMWSLIDTNCDGGLDYMEFSRAFAGEMSETRKALVRRAFSRVDHTRTGLAVLNDIIKFFNPNQHPQVLQGETTATELVNEIINNFQSNKSSTEVPYSLFETYYEGVSIDYEVDGQFIQLIRDCWTL